MRKLLYCTLVGLAAATIVACEDDPKNPGDFSLETQLKLDGKIVSLNTGAEYPLVVARETDTTYAYHHTLYDTLKDNTGEPILDSKGKLQITERDTVVFSKVTAKFVEYEPVRFPSFKDLTLDTMVLSFSSNATWEAPMNAAVGWYSNVGGTLKGGGDADFKFSVKQFANEMSKHVVTQHIITRDSTKLVRLTFTHSGLKYAE